MFSLIAEAATLTASAAGSSNVSSVLVTVFSILLVLVSIVMIVLVMLQEGDEKGLSGTITGYGADSYASKNAGRTKEGQLKKYTRIALVAFMVLALAINILQ